MKCAGPRGAVLPRVGRRDPRTFLDTVTYHPHHNDPKGPITRKLEHVLGAAGLMAPNPAPLVAVEVATGTGCHLEAFCKAFPALVWQPSEYIPELAQPETEKSSKIGAARPFDGDRDRTLALIVSFCVSPVSPSSLAFLSCMFESVVDS